MRAEAFEALNPLLPASYDLIWSASVAAIVALTLVVLWQALRSRELTGVQSLMWVVLILALPVLGAIGWFVLRPKAAPAARSQAEQSATAHSDTAQPARVDA